MRRLGGRAAVIAGVGCLALLVSVRCANVTRGLGEACIRNEDCLSNVCAGQECVATPTVFDAAPAPIDAGVDAGDAGDAGDATTDGPTAADTGAPPQDSGQHDARVGAPDATHPHDASTHADAATPDSATHDAHDGTHDSGGSKDSAASADAHPG